ncbi:MAG: 4Fe-4S dicluster domain-containing protein [Candidatus Methanoperedens sp.]|nr:4Fe-4S dicluster domain-containing protein [Candidatus Methanoperedens sp.]
MNMNRRNFLKIGGSLLAWGLVGSSAASAGARSFTGYPDRFGMLSDLTRCIGCRRCEAACNKANNLPPPKTSFEDSSVFEEKRKPYVADVQSYTVVNRYGANGKTVYRKVQCMHCEEPACASACLVGALTKSPEGPVVWNEELCIGCRYCIVACPFYVPAFEYSSAFEPRIQKCFMCHQRITNGIVPACAEACPVEAITFGKRSSLLKLAWTRIWGEPDKYIDHVYGEREAGGTGWMYISGVPFSQLDFQMDIGTTSFPEYTKDFLSMVNLTLISWPAIFGGMYLMTNNLEKKNHAEVTEPEKEENKL